MFVDIPVIFALPLACIILACNARMLEWILCVDIHVAIYAYIYTVVCYMLSYFFAIRWGILAFCHLKLVYSHFKLMCGINIYKHMLLLKHNAACLQSLTVVTL